VKDVSTYGFQIERDFGPKNTPEGSPRVGDEMVRKGLSPLGLLSEIAADHALISVLLADLADGLSGALIVLIAAADLHSSGASTLGVLLSLGGHIWGWGGKGGWLSTGIPDAHLSLLIEDGSRGAGHSLPSSTVEIVGSWLTLEEMGSTLGVSRQRIDHPRADALIGGILHSSLH
jgi:hypothetical protein